MTASLRSMPLNEKDNGAIGDFPAPRMNHMAKPSRQELTIGLIRTRCQFDALETEWNDLHRRSGPAATVFQSFNWHWHWCNHYLDNAADQNGAGHGMSLAVITIRQQGRLVLIWPTVIERVAGLRQLTWMGDPVSQYGDVLCDPAADARLLLETSWRHIRKLLQVDLICLRKVREDAVIAPFLTSIGATLFAMDEAVSHNLARDKRFARYMERFNRRARRNRRRQKQKLQQCGAISFHEYNGGDDARAIVLHAVAMKRDWLKQAGLVSRAYGDKRFDAFFAAVALGEDHPSGCVVSVLRCADKIAAVKIGLIDKKCRYNHITVYNTAFKKYGAGAHHMERTIESAFKSDLETFDLLAPKTRYKTEWADDLTKVCDYGLGLNLRGRSYVAIYLNALRPLAKTTIEKLPPVLVKLVHRFKG